MKGEGLEHGTVLRGIVAPPLPYRMRLDVVVDECVPERRISALVHGDLEGAAQLTFDGDDVEARAHATWKLEMMQRPMRLACRIAPHCFGGATIASSRRPSKGFAVTLAAKAVR